MARRPVGSHADYVNRKNCLNAEVHTMRKYNCLVSLAGSLIKEMLYSQTSLKVKQKQN